MRFHQLFLLASCSAVLLLACGRLSTVFSPVIEQERQSFLATTAEVGDAMSPLATPPITTTIDSPLPITPTVTTVAPLDPDEAWLTYTDPRGFRFEYPSNWVIYTTPYGTIDIRTPITLTDCPPEGVNVGFGYLYDEDSEDMEDLIWAEDIPNEGGYRRFWITTFPTDDGIGWMYVWGNYQFCGDSPCYPQPLHHYNGSLQVNFYNEADGAIVRLGRGDYSTLDVDLTEVVGLRAIVAERNPTTQHIVETFRFLPPLATPTPRP